MAFFDDFNVQVSESPFIQGTLYYSYGMIAMQEVREGEEETRQLFRTKDWTRKPAGMISMFDSMTQRWEGVCLYIPEPIRESLSYNG